MEIKPVICKSEREFLNLLGDGSEIVKVTFGDSMSFGQLNGWWLYEKLENKNSFTKQYPYQKVYPQMVDRFFCDTICLQFDKEMGIHPNFHYYEYRPLGERNIEERDTQIKKLKERGMWR